MLLAIGLVTACSNAPASETTTGPEATFQPLLDKVVAKNEAVPGLQLHVEAPRINISWNGAAGVSDVAAKTELQKDQPFRVASVTKTFVATAILKLMEAGKLTLDDPITAHISEEHAAILRAGNYDPDQINIRHLLTHTSGLFDYALGNEVYSRKVAKDPKHRWTRTEQLQGAMEWGESKGAPGERYHYSDTGYILLGEIIEKHSGANLAGGLRTIIGYEELGLKSTWLESLEDAPTGLTGRTHQYLQGADTYEWDPSMDLYGGGGLVSTTSDLARFYQALFNEKVFDQAATLDTMLQKVPLAEIAEADRDPKARNIDYRCGVEVANAFNTELYMHTGFWGIQVAYIPAYDATVALNFVQGNNYFLLKKLVSVIAELDFEGADQTNPSTTQSSENERTSYAW